MNHIKMPSEYAYLEEIVKMDPPAGEMKEAMDLYLMTLKCFGKGAWSDNKLSSVLAWAWMASFNEACVLSGIRIPLLIASYRYGIRGGCIPRIDLLQAQVSPKVKELYNLGAKTPWLERLMEEYKITHWQKINYQENTEVLKAPWI